MEVFHDATPVLIEKSAIALGFFDGVHPGHQVVIGKAVEEARRLGIKAAVVTFTDHPRALIAGVSPLLLTVIEQRLELFASLGVEATLALSFTEDLCRLSPQEYVETVLVKSMGARSISVGHNHHFGRDREGDPALLSQLGKELDFCVHVAPMVEIDGQEVSSSRVREALSAGRVDLAARLLSRPYAILGQVVPGAGRGHGLGFPTANIGVAHYQLIPGRGVYAGRARLSGGERVDAVINVGYRPTFSRSAAANGKGLLPADQDSLCVEVHLLNFDRDLYGSKMQVEFLKFLREEQKFESIDALKTQIAADCNVAREFLKSVSAGKIEAVKEHRLPA